MTGRLGQAGLDGSATVAISLDGKGSAVGTGGTLSGQINADGELAGQISGRGPDLSLLLPAPARPWRADGQVKAGSGLVIAQDLELDIGGAPARGAVAVRLLPQLRLDAALATSQLDLDAWLAPLVREGQPPLPTGIELSADAAQLAGGTLHHLRTGFEFSQNGLTLREAEAVLPGNATLHLTGRLADGRFAGDARLVGAGHAADAGLAAAARPCPHRRDPARRPEDGAAVRRRRVGGGQFDVRQPDGRRERGSGVRRHGAARR